jgi:hypothetical protein
MPIVAAECQATRRGSGVEIVDPDVRLALDGDITRRASRLADIRGV